MMEKLFAVYLGGWEQALSASRLAAAIGVTREHASRKVLGWVRHAYMLGPEEGSRRIARIEDGPDRFPSGLRGPRELMELLPGLTLLDYAKKIEDHVFNIRGLVAAEGDPDLFRAVYAAMCRREALLLRYRAKSGELACWFSPHALADLPRRPHFRGHAEWVQEREWGYIDMVPARIILIDGADPGRYVGPGGDEGWQTEEELIFALRESLPEEVRGALIQEWGHQLQTERGRVVLRVPGVRRALAPYVRDELLWRPFRGEMYQVFEPITP